MALRSWSATRMLRRVDLRHQPWYSTRFIANVSASTGEEAVGLTKGRLRTNGVRTGDTQDLLPEAGRRFWRLFWVGYREVSVSPLYPQDQAPFGWVLDW